jgi:RNA polymerase sigma factor (sigma-70 family)
MTDPAHPETLFATTRWTLVGAAARGGETQAVEALGALFQTYWAPLYRYVRRCGRSATDAEDLVQGFFASLIEGDGVQSADRERGRFRAFLLGALKHYMTDQWRHQHRLKRGGFAPHLSIDWQDAETGLSLVPEDPRSPDRLFDREWAIALIYKVLDDLGREEEDFERWKSFLSIRSDHLSYAEIALKIGMTEGAARVAVHRMRKRYRQRLREEIRGTLEDEQMVDEEMKALFAALFDDF